MMTALASRNGRTAALAGLLVAAMVGLAFASVPLYRLFCQVTGLRRHDPARRGRRGARAGRADDQRPLRRQHLAGSALALRAGRHPPPDRDRRAQHRPLHRAQPLRPAGDRHRDLQRHALAGRAVFHQDPVLLLHRAEARRPGRKCRCRSSSSSTPRSSTIRPRARSARSPFPTPFTPWTRQGREVRDRTDVTGMTVRTKDC